MKTVDYTWKTATLAGDEVDIVSGNGIPFAAILFRDGKYMVHKWADGKLGEFVTRSGAHHSAFGAACAYGERKGVGQ